MNRRKGLKIYAGVGIMTMALLMHMNMTIRGNSKTREVAFNDLQEIVIPKNDTENKRKGR